MKLKNFACAAVVIWLSASNALPANAGFTVIRQFVGGRFSATSFAPLIADRAGNLYGTASAGGNGGCVRYGSTGCGTVFELTPSTAQNGPWTETVIYRFPGGNGPWMPTAGLTIDAAGNLYGMTTDGGIYGCFTQNCGTASELKRPSTPGGDWKETVLYRFSSGNGGNNPGSGLTLDGKGNLYGTTMSYGPQLNGTVFRLTPPANGRGWWTEKVLSGFDRGGSFPPGNVVFDKSGNLYGTTFYGGPQNFGLVFMLVPKQRGYWTETVLYAFGTNACSPNTNLIFDESGNLYGTAQGCPALSGAAFRLTPPAEPGGSWTEQVLAYFPGNTNYDPTTGLVLDSAGNLYGTTASRGTYGYGTVFQLKSTTWVQTVLHSFKRFGEGGDFPTAGPIFGLGGALYGTTPYGGDDEGVCKVGGCGVVYQVTP